jgi:hypothetical protein
MTAEPFRIVSLRHPSEPYCALAYIIQPDGENVSPSIHSQQNRLLPARLHEDFERLLPSLDRIAFPLGFCTR